MKQTFSLILTDKIGIDALLNHFDVTEHIEAKLNREDSFLQNWRHLAELYKADGLVSDEDIKNLEPEKDARSPTAGLVLYVLKKDSNAVKVEDLVVHCANMRRTDCLNIIARYLKGRPTYLPCCTYLHDSSQNTLHTLLLFCVSCHQNVFLYSTCGIDAANLLPDLNPNPRFTLMLHSILYSILAAHSITRLLMSIPCTL